MNDWILKNEEEGTSVWTLTTFIPMFLYDLKKTVGKPLHCSMEFEGTRMRWYPSKTESEQLSIELVEKLKNRPIISQTSRKKLVNDCEKLNAFSQALSQNTGDLTNEEIGEYFEKHHLILRGVLAEGMITTLPDFGEGRYVSFLEAFLEKRIREKKLGKKAPELLAELTYESGENIQKQELKALLELAVEIQKANIGGTDPERLENELNRRPEIKKRLSDHVKAFEWAYFGYTGPVLTEKKVLEELALMQKEEKHAEKELERMKRESIQAEQKKKEAQKALDLSPREREWFQVASDAVFTKTYRRDATTYSFYRMTPLLREVSRRTKMPLERVQCIMAGEMNEVLENPKAWEPELKARQEYCICTAEGEAPRMYSGKEAKAYAKRFIPVEKVEDVNEIVGKCACPGIAVGRVRVIDTPTEMHGMKKGDILVSTATQPDIVPAMKKAAAIVTNIGGITSHAAIVSRELGVPCVIGTRIATKVLKNGDLVEVDATNGIVKKIKEWPKKEKTIFQ